jgi:hypothetical protein
MLAVKVVRVMRVMANDDSKGKDGDRESRE